MKRFKGDPQKVASYFLNEKKVLAVVAISGICYNIGMAAGPYFEGQLAQYLYDMIRGMRKPHEIVVLSLIYVLVILFVQFSRFIKRFSVRRFANNINKELKTRIYHYALHMSKSHEGIGSLMTKAISDAEACGEGMRKATTEVFDTGVVMIVYLVMLFSYDWRLTLLCLIFPPIAYAIAIHLRKIVTQATALARKSADTLNAATLDMTAHALTYRAYGCEKPRRDSYETVLNDYEHKTIAVNIWNDSLQPIYLAISMVGLMPILYFGGRNVLGDGWRLWNIAAFSTYIACFSKLAKKSSSGAKLFNAIQKAEVSWQRIKTYLGDVAEDVKSVNSDFVMVNVHQLSFRYPDDDKIILHDLSFSIKQGEIIGVTGQVASGKSTLGKFFLNESPYQGEIEFITADGKKTPLKDLNSGIAYLGHQYELFNMSLADNIRLGVNDQIRPEKDQRLWQVIDEVCFSEEVKKMPEGLNTMLGDGGEELSGGQAQRIALARALYHHASLYILDDPFSAVDESVEKTILNNLRYSLKHAMIVLISHRLNIFPELDDVLWLEDGKGQLARHDEMIKTNQTYRKLYAAQQMGSD